MNVIEQHFENQRKHDIVPMKTLLAELKARTNIGLELDPSYTQGLRGRDNLYVDYKLHERGSAAVRILNLLIQETEYTRDSSGSCRFHPDTAEQVKVEILNFWNGETTDPVRTKLIPAQS